MNTDLPRGFRHGGWSLLMALAALAMAGEAPDPAIMGKVGAEDFHERQAAQAQLMVWGRERPEEAISGLYERWRTEPDPEIRRRCGEVLRELVLGDYRKNGEGYVGIRMVPVAVVVPGDAGKRFGIQINELVPGGPAAKAGMAVGDTVVAADEQQWRDGGVTQAFQKWTRQHKPGSKITLKLLRGGKELTLPLILERRPPERTAAFPPGVSGDPARLGREAEDAYFEDWLKARSPAG